MATHMKTTILLPDSLMDEARQLAHEEQTTLKALVEEGLRHVLSQHRRRARFKLRQATFKGEGLQPPLDGVDWSRIRELAQEGRGT